MSKLDYEKRLSVIDGIYNALKEKLKEDYPEYYVKNQKFKLCWMSFIIGFVWAVDIVLIIIIVKAML